MTPLLNGSVYQRFCNSTSILSMRRSCAAARLSAAYCVLARDITPAKSLTILAPNPLAGVKVIPLPDEERIDPPFKLVSVDLTLPIAFAMSVGLGSSAHTIGTL